MKPAPPRIMPRYTINSELSFLYPDECRILKKMKGHGFSLIFDDLKKDSESYYVKWVDAKTPNIAWNILQDSKFDKSKKLMPLKRDIKVEGFRLKKVPKFNKIRLAHQQYVSFRGSEYAKDKFGNEWIELTWCRMYCVKDDKKLKIMSVGFVAAGEAKVVTQRIRKHFMNMINGIRYTPKNMGKWMRVPVTVQQRKSSSKTKVSEKPVQPPGNPARGTPVSTSSGSSASFMKTKQCYSCSGSGVSTCSVCGGSGGRNEQRMSYDWEGYPQYDFQWVSCFCNGGSVSCAVCSGKGYVYA